MAIIAREPTLLGKFGGHAMAAGATIAESNLGAFRQAFVAAVNRQLNGKALQREWLTDGALNEQEMSLANASQVKYLQPWGQAFPFPSFDDDFLIRDVRIVGSGHSKLLLRRVGGYRDIPAVAFNRVIDNADQLIWRIVYRLDVNRYRNKESLQLLVDYMAPVQ